MVKVDLILGLVEQAIGDNNFKWNWNERGPPISHME
jgi:hypothetical protein